MNFEVYGWQQIKCQPSKKKRSIFWLWRSIFFLLLFDFFVIICTGAFQDVLTRGYWKEFLATFRQAVLIELVFVAYLIVMRSEQYWRLVIFLRGFYYLVLCYVVKIAWKAFVKKEERWSMILCW